MDLRLQIKSLSSALNKCCTAGVLRTGRGINPPPPPPMGLRDLNDLGSEFPLNV